MTHLLQMYLMHPRIRDRGNFNQESSLDENNDKLSIYQHAARTQIDREMDLEMDEWTDG